MKTISFRYAFVLLATIPAVLVSGCSSGSSSGGSSTQPTLNTQSIVAGARSFEGRVGETAITAVFVDADLPPSSGGPSFFGTGLSPEDSLARQTRVVEGGAAVIGLATSSSSITIDQVNVGVAGLRGFWRLNFSAREAVVVRAFITNLLVGDTARLAYQVGSNGALSSVFGQDYSVVAASSEQLEVTLTWSNLTPFASDPDVDIAIVEPGSQNLQSKGAQSTSTGTLTNTAGCSSGTKLERATWNGAPFGPYRVNVVIADFCDGTGLSATYTLTVRRGGAVLATFNDTLLFTGSGFANMDHAFLLP